MNPFPYLSIIKNRNMGKQKNEIKKNRKKEFRSMVSAKLETALSDFKNAMDEKKFEGAIKKASKLLSQLLFIKKKKKMEKKADIEIFSA